MPRSSDKRARLAQSADELILAQGFRDTTLADIADHARIPLGNLYYYFRSKDAIGRTVIDKRLRDMEQLLAHCAAKPDPKSRLLEFLSHPLTIRDNLVAHGCPLGTLSYELSRVDGPLSGAAGELITVLLDWSRVQFEGLDSTNAEARALEFVTSLQGMSLVANALSDPGVIDQTVGRLRRWIVDL